MKAAKRRTPFPMPSADQGRIRKRIPGARCMISCPQETGRDARVRAHRAGAELRLFKRRRRTARHAVPPFGATRRNGIEPVAAGGTGPAKTPSTDQKAGNQPVSLFQCSAAANLSMTPICLLPFKFKRFTFAECRRRRKQIPDLRGHVKAARTPSPRISCRQSSFHNAVWSI